MRTTALVLSCALLAATGCEKSLNVKRIEPPGVKPVPIEVPTNEKAELGWYPAVQIGPDGNLHLAYCDVTRGDVRYGLRDASGVLRLESAAEQGAVGKYIALAVDAQNQPHILFHDQDNKQLMYTTKTATGWVLEKVAWGPEIGMGARLIVHAGRLYSIFYDSREQLRLAERPALTEKPAGTEEAWEVEVVDKAGGGWSVWTDLVVIGDKLVASYMHWNFVSAELRLGERALEGGEWQARVLFPLRKLTPGWMTSIIPGEAGGLSLAFTTIQRERVFFGPIPAEGDMRETPIVGYFLNRMRAKRAPNGDLVMAVAETGKGRLGNATLAIIRRRGEQWSRYTVDSRRPVASKLDLAVGPGGEAIVLYFSDIDRGVYLYDESTTTRVEGARPSPEVREDGTAVLPAAQYGAVSGSTDHAASAPAAHAPAAPAPAPAPATKPEPVKPAPAEPAPAEPAPTKPAPTKPAPAAAKPQPAQPKPANP